MIDWKSLNSDDQLPDETIIVADKNSVAFMYRFQSKWHLEDGESIVEIQSPSKEFTHWSEINLPK